MFLNPSAVKPEKRERPQRKENKGLVFLLGEEIAPIGLGEKKAKEGPAPLSQTTPQPLFSFLIIPLTR